MLPTPEGDMYDLAVIGTEEGEYDLTIVTSDGKGGLTNDRVSRTTSVGQIDSYTVTTQGGTDELPSYLKDILALIPKSEQKKFISAFKVVYGQSEKNHVAVTKTLIENLIKYTFTKYKNDAWTPGVVAALRGLL